MSDNWLDTERCAFCEMYIFQVCLARWQDKRHLCKAAKERYVASIKTEERGDTKNREIEL